MFKRAENYWKTVLIRIAIERDLAQAISDARKREVARDIAHSRKVLQANNKECSGGKRRTRKKGKRSHNVSKQFMGQHLPAALAQKPEEKNPKKQLRGAGVSLLMLRLAGKWIRRVLFRNPYEAVDWYEKQIAKNEYKIDTCVKLAHDGPKKEQDLRNLAMQKRKQADRLLRKAAKQKVKSNPIIKEAADLNRNASELERDASASVELQELRLPILRKRTEKLESQQQKLLAKLRILRDELIAEQAEKADTLIQKSRRARQVGQLARMEKNVAEREALAALGAEAIGELRLSESLFTEMEQKVAEAEKLAANSTEMLAKIPWVDIKTLDESELSGAQLVFEAAKDSLQTAYDGMLATEKHIKQAIAYREESVNVWKAREELARKQKNFALVQNAQERGQVFIDSATGLGEFLESHRARIATFQALIEKLDAAVIIVTRQLDDVRAANSSAAKPSSD